MVGIGNVLGPIKTYDVTLNISKHMPKDLGVLYYYYFIYFKSSSYPENIFIFCSLLLVLRRCSKIFCSSTDFRFELCTIFQNFFAFRILIIQVATAHNKNKLLVTAIASKLFKAFCQPEIIRDCVFKSWKHFDELLNCVFCIEH